MFAIWAWRSFIRSFFHVCFTVVFWQKSKHTFILILHNGHAIVLERTSICSVMQLMQNVCRHGSAFGKIILSKHISHNVSFSSSSIINKPMDRQRANRLLVMSLLAKFVIPTVEVLLSNLKEEPSTRVIMISFLQCHQFQDVTFLPQSCTILLSRFPLFTANQISHSFPCFFRTSPDWVVSVKESPEQDLCSHAQWWFLWPTYFQISYRLVLQNNRWKDETIAIVRMRYGAPTLIGPR